MRYIVLLNLYLILCAGAHAAQTAGQAADQSRYRVELIVLTHLEHDEQPQEAPALEDYSKALDFLTPAAAEADAGGAPTAAEALPEPTPATMPATMPETGAVDGEGAGSGAATDTAVDPWNVVVHVPELGEQMQDVWRRLHLSGPFRPLQALAWEQGGNAPFPTLRLHDLEVVLTQDPSATDQTALAGTPTPGQLAGEAPPPPIQYYRLDGTASLTRSRFLHLALAVELREPLYEAALNEAATPGNEPPERATPENGLEPSTGPAPTSFLLHRLAQSRVVMTGRMEYFDGPVLGVLAWVTDISDTVAVEPAE